MAEIRRRVGNALRETPSPSPAPRDRKPEQDETHQLISKQKLRTLTTRKRSKRRTGLIFAFGGLFGIFVALFFAKQQEVISFEGLPDFNFNSLLDAVPAGFVKDLKDLTVCLP